MSIDLYFNENKPIIELFKGSNIVLDDKSKMNIEKDYPAENGSGFYLAEDIKIAKNYAFMLYKTYGGSPILNIYNFNLKLAREKFKIAIFNELDERTIKYLGYNMIEKLPEDCNLILKNIIKNTRPQNICYKCNDENCEWNAEVIKSLLSQGEGFYNIDNYIINYMYGLLSLKDIIISINKITENSGLFRQITLRERSILDCLHFKRYEILDKE